MLVCGICKQSVGELMNFDDYVASPKVQLYEIIQKCTKHAKCKFVENGVCSACVLDLVSFHEAVSVAKQFKQKILSLIEKIPEKPITYNESIQQSDTSNDNDNDNDNNNDSNHKDTPSCNVVESEPKKVDIDDDTEDEKDEIVTSNECKECGKVFADRLACKLHTEQRHMHQRCFVCDLCGKEVRSKYNFERHKKSHNKEDRPYTCNICNKRFQFMDLFRDHLARHSGIKPFKCTICQKSYPHKRSLSNHMMTHKNVHKTKTEHECPTCHKIIISAHNFKKHMLTHSDVISHFCKYCNRGFVVKYYLTQHLKEHSKCSKAYLEDPDRNK